MTELTFSIAPGYHGMCWRCDKDIWDPEGILEYTEFKEENKSEASRKADAYLADHFGLPPVEGVWTPVHRHCVRDGAVTKEVN